MTEFDALLDEYARLRAAGNHNSDHWNAMFERFLKRPGMAEPAARAQLEAQLVAWLDGGWEPGKDLLLGAADKVFDWTNRAEHLQALGDSGAAVAKALGEYAEFRKQPTPLLNLQWAAIRHMREGVGTDGRAIRRSLTYFRTLRERFPSWLPMVASPAAIAQWVALAAQPPEQLRREYKDARGPLLFQWGMALSVVIFVVVRLLTPAPLGKSQRQLVDGYVATTGNYKPSREWINSVLARAHHTSTSDQAKAPGTYKISLTKLGNIEKVELQQASSDPAFDASAMKAIRESPGFPSDIARSFTLTLYPR